ncbi:GAF domain-containing protein [Bacillus tuaregi]|uniref:GAF domain-containing protein n=1 Tax=Bacillus tuaregi TaxID=1816695 RepID=UPI0008F94A31|nr:GAF domain-containing protein [Bacillus tuaregi]
MDYKECNQGGTCRYIESCCEKVLAALNCDFVGVAIQNSDGPDVKWHYAAGNSNDKYMRITVRYGKGIAGKVISTGRSMTVEDFPNHIIGKPLEYPIMLAERLLSAYAVPIQIKGIPKGVLLVGNRTKRTFSEEEHRVVLLAAKGLEETLNSNRRK